MLHQIPTRATFAQLQALTLPYLAAALEKRILSHYGKGNALDAVRLERDVSGVVQVVMQGGGGGREWEFRKFRFRESFARVRRGVWC